MLVLNGDFTGRGNFIIQGRVEADVALEARDVTVSKTGSVRADIHGATICVEGEVQGNLVGLESVVIRPSGRVRGDVIAPSVNLERGGRLLGTITTAAATHLLEPEAAGLGPSSLEARATRFALPAQTLPATAASTPAVTPRRPVRALLPAKTPSG